MSAVHKPIILAALSVLPEDKKAELSPYRSDLEKSSGYPDKFAGIAIMSEEEINEIDPEARRFIYPDPPDCEWYREIERITAGKEKFGAVPLRDFHLVQHYLEKAVESLQEGDLKGGAKFCGVYSHVIADIAEPIHALNPDIVDMVFPPPQEYIGMELHGSVEQLRAPVNIEGYQPKLLGGSLKQAMMGAYAALEKAVLVGRAQTVPIVQALYANDKEKATSLSSLAQNESARAAADFMFTVLCLGDDKGNTSSSSVLDLREYPYAACEVDMLYRYRPMIDISLIPYSGGQSHPLSLIEPESGTIQNVRGLGVVPFLEPVREGIREAVIEYFIVPGAYRTFSSCVGCNPLFENSMMSVVFRMFGDGEELYRSPEINPGDKPVDINVPLNGARWLKLSMSYVGHPAMDDIRRCAKWSWPSHGVWADPVLE